MIRSILFHWFLVLVLSPFFIGVIARVKAWVAGKVGPPICQPYFDIIKLCRKRSVYSDQTTWIFRAAPVVALAGMLVLSLLIPFGVFPAPVCVAGDVFLAVYLLALARFFVMAAALDTGSSLEGLGASREAFFSCLSELALFMNMVTLALLAQSTSLSHMIGAIIPVSWGTLGPALLLVVASLFMVLLAENGRIPVDDPDTHLELTMIHEVMVLDHSGVDLAYLLYASTIKFLVFAAILVPILVPVRTGNQALDMLIFLGGMSGLCVLVAGVESSMARVRLQAIRNLLLMAFSLAFFGLVVALWRIWI